MCGHDALLPIVNSLRAHTIDPTAQPDDGHGRPCPSRVGSEQPDPVLLVSPRRRSRVLNSYRANKKVPLHLLQQPNAEKIGSVSNTVSGENQSLSEGERLHPTEPTQDNNGPRTRSHTTSSAALSQASSLRAASSIYSNQRAGPSLTPDHTCADQSSPSLFRRIMARRTEQSERPTRLVIQRNVSIDHTSSPA